MIERNLFYDYNVKNSQMSELSKIEAMKQLEERQAQALDDAKNMRINYKIIHFVKFCKLSDTMNNFSNEVFDFYINLF